MGRYRRTVSFPNPIPSFYSNPRPKSYHVRSVSLPCGRIHPLIPQLRDEIGELRAWDRAGFGSGHLIDGLGRLKGILDSFDDVLQLPQTQDALSYKTNVVEKLLEDFLRFVDVYEVFHASMLGLRQELSSAQVALRRKDDTKLGLYVKAQKKIATEIGKLISTVGSMAAEQGSAAIQPSTSCEFDDELLHVIHDVHKLVASVSEAVLNGVSGTFGPGRKLGWAGFGVGRKGSRKEGECVEEFQNVIRGVETLLLELKKKKNNDNNNNNEVKMGVLKRMQEMEDCVGEMERESGRVFRSLISTRVSLLNILTHA